jgi:FKBP-type peptidyl-prolyl cis-trans isomerase
VAAGPCGDSGGEEWTVMTELTKPSVEVLEGDAPPELTIRDLVAGEGPEAQPGRVVQVHYVGVTFASGREFDSSWERDQPFKFAVGGGRAIKGLDRGVRGMKVGGRREIIVPPRLGYGRESPSPLIPAGSTLIFVVDLLTVAGGPAGARPGPP